MDPILLYTNYSTKFLLPLVIKDGYTFKDIETNLIDAYIADIKQPEFDQCIIIVFNDDVRPLCLKDNYIDNIVSKTETKDEYDYMYVYRIEDNDLEDYFNFINGTYSEFTEITKQKILKFWNVGEDSLLYCILYKDKKNIENVIKNITNEKSPWRNIYSKFINRLKDGKEFYNQPDLRKEMYGYSAEE